MTTKQELEFRIQALESTVQVLMPRIVSVETKASLAAGEVSYLKTRVSRLEAAGRAARGYAPEEPLDDFSLLDEGQLRYVLRRLRDFLREDAASSWVNRGDVLHKIRDLVDGKS